LSAVAFVAKLFTPEQADRTLPLVRRIVEDVVRADGSWREVVDELERERSALDGERADLRVRELERRAAELARDMDALEAELGELGIALKDRRIGLIDFPGELDGRPVWLCWRLGEPAVRYWHELDAGFAGRQPLPVG
jgi:hypothetical protein